MSRATQQAKGESAPGSEMLVAGLCRLLAVVLNEDGSYHGKAIRDSSGRIFGGQILGQAVMAAGDTVAGRLPHSLHAYFLRPGKNEKPVRYQVHADLDGGTFSNRRVVAMQDDAPILSMAISFHSGDRGVQHTTGMPDVPRPEDLMSDAAWVQKFGDSLPAAIAARFGRPRPLEFRRIDPLFPHPEAEREPFQKTWVRTAAPVAAANPLLHCALLAYLSDMGLMSTSIRAHNLNWGSDGLQGASIDHALWFHDRIDVGDWMLYTMDSPWADHGRGMNRGQIFAADGRLIASVMQEGLNRFRG